HMPLEQDRAVHRRMIISRAGPRARHKTVAAAAATTLGIYRYSWPQDVLAAIKRLDAVQMEFRLSGYVTNANSEDDADHDVFFDVRDGILGEDELFVTHTIDTSWARKSSKLQERVSLQELL
ncbi:MAG: hypothetical protein AAGI01_14620, partial [Myxococcota bacterium]